MTRLVCAIDVGTNTLLALFAEADGGALRVVDDLVRVPRLGRGVDASSRLAPDAIHRTLEVLREVRERADALGVHTIAAVGTSALRDAQNRDELVEAARALGIPLRPISGEDEARYTFSGATHGLGLDDETVTVIDVGGGSTEIVRGRAGAIERSRSLNIGSVRLYERHFRHDPPTDEERRALLTDVDRALETVPFDLSRPLVGLAGTACTLAAVARGIDSDVPSSVHGERLSAAELVHHAGALAARTIEARRATPGVPRGREDVVAAGALILSRVVHRAGLDELIVSSGGVRWGLAAEMLANAAD